MTTTSTINRNCTFADPISYDGTAPTLKTHSFYFRSSTCVETYDGTPFFPEISIGSSSAASTTQKFVDGFSYGEIVIASFLLFMLIGSAWSFTYRKIARKI